MPETSASQMGHVLHSLPVHSNLQTWVKEHQGGCAVTADRGSGMDGELEEHNFRHITARPGSMGCHDRNHVVERTNSTSASMPVSSHIHTSTSLGQVAAPSSGHQGITATLNLLQN